MFGNGRSVYRESIAFVDDAWIEAEIFGSSIVIQESVMFPFHVVQFGKNISRDLFVPAQFVREEFEAPTHVTVPIESADAAVLTVDERLTFVFVARYVIELGANVGGLHDLVDVLPGPSIIIDIEVPGIDIGVAMSEV